MTNQSNNEEKAIEIKTQTSEEGFVILPFNNEQFKGFINSLLGTPQSLGKKFYDSFELEPDQIKNLHQLIQQRVSQQNNGTLVRFLGRITYSDNSSVELNSITELLTYNEIKPISSKALNLIWDYLVIFPERGAPEKQRIQIIFLIPEASLALDLDSDEIRRKTAQEIISIRIEHTARTWGLDMISMLQDYIKSSIMIENDFNKTIKGFMVKHKEGISSTIAITSFVITLFSSFYLYGMIRFDRIQRESALMKGTGSSVIDINKKIDYIVSKVISGAITEDNSYIILIGLFFSLFLAGSIYLYSYSQIKQPPSFILLTKYSYKERSKSLASYNRKWSLLVLSYIFGILAGIISNIIYDRFFR